MAHTFEARIGLDRFPIIIGRGIFKEIISFINTYEKNNVFIIVDSFFKTSNNIYSEDLHFIKNYIHLYIDGGIESKNISSFQFIIKELVKNNIARDGLIVAIGGGVIGDLAAFVASTYQRGVDIIQVPTTTTSMIDSSLGGKTGINHLDQVNLIGSYYNPKGIFMDTRFLNSLNQRDFYSGVCEAIKMAITSDKNMFYRFNSIAKLTKSRNPEILEEIIYWSAITKLKHVASDLKEKSLRLILNYGHTFGQAIESFYGLYQDTLKHGEAVALGITVAANLSNRINNNPESNELYLETKRLLFNYNLPTKFSNLKTEVVPEISKLIDNISNDKKRIYEGNRFIICKSIGKPFVKIINDKDLIFNSFKCLY